MIRRIEDKLKSASPTANGTVPADASVREYIRARARGLTENLPRANPLKRPDLERLAKALLDEIKLSDDSFGFAMVAVSNEFWRSRFASIPYSARLLLLPHCLRKLDACTGKYNSLGLECASCGACHICEIKTEAESLGYHVLIAEGTPAVVQLVLSGKADAILGVACLDSLEKAFERVVELGIPHIATPLLVDGCTETTAELGEVQSLMRLHSADPVEHVRTYVHLLRAAERLFEPGILDALLAGEVQPGAPARPAPADDPVHGTEVIALDWLRTGGKRFRPFVTLASYAAMTMGEDALRDDADLSDALPDVVQRAALAIEALHKASLVHDDIEDDDAYRYGHETLHRRYGVANAVNVGDYLIGLGYRLIASGAEELGPECTADMIGMLARSHVRLSRGQGAELLWRDRDLSTLRPVDLLTIYGLKTAPAFEAAMYVGLRAARDDGAWAERLDAYSRYLGTAYQVLNDLKDWTTDARDKKVSGQDLLAARPTVLLAFALESGTEAENRELIGLVRAPAPDRSRVERVAEIYRSRAVFTKAEALVDKYRRRADAAATGMEPPALRELMHFLVDVLLR